MNKILTALLALGFTSLTFAQTLYLTADAMVDVAAGRLVQNPVLVIQNDRIERVGTAGEIGIPQGANHLDLSGHTLVPGLIDTHTHLNADATVHGYGRFAVSTPRAAITGVLNAQVTLMAGVTTVRNVGAAGFVDTALRDAINEGDVIGPRMFVSGPSIGVTGGHCDNNLLPYEWGVTSQGVADGPWQMRQKVRENLKYGVDMIKFCATGGVLSKGTEVGVQQFTFEEMEALVDEAHRLGLLVAAHAHGTDGINDAIRAGVDTIEHASFIDDAGIRMALSQGTYLSMDIYVTEYILGEGEAAGMLQESLDKELLVGGVQRENFTKAVRQGVNMVMGTDAGVYPHGDNLKQLARMVQFGMSPMQALQAASINGATMLHQQENIGSLQAGRYADIIAVAGNPLEDISILEQVAFVMKGGVVHKTP